MMARGKSQTDSSDDSIHKVRLDKWLWAARFYKTRGLAQEAIDGGHVHINGDRAKPARAVKVGDEIELRLNQLVYQLEVIALAERRGPATEARLLYHESEASQAAREARTLELKAGWASFPQGDGRPTKKSRRQLNRFRQQDGA